MHKDKLLAGFGPKFAGIGVTNFLTFGFAVDAHQLIIRFWQVCFCNKISQKYNLVIYLEEQVGSIEHIFFWQQNVSEGQKEALLVLTSSNRDLIEPTGRREGSITLIAIRALLEPPNRSTVRLIETTLL